MNKAQVRSWLLTYAWLGTPAEQEREVDCILAQGEWKSVDVRADHRAEIVAESGEEPDYSKTLNEAYGMELSALYECHDGPHLATCPRKGE